MDVADVPCAGHRGVVADVGIHGAFFLSESAANGAQGVVAGGEWSAEVAGILRDGKSVCVRLEGIESVAPNIETADAEVAGQLFGRRDLQGVVIGIQV